MITRKQAYEALERVFGYKQFRAGQMEVIRSIFQNQDTLGIMSTGAGKSLCYQFPSLFLPGITLVISPLIALMQDQVENLHKKGYGSATYINSSLRLNEVKMRIEQIRQGMFKIVYIAPERLRSLEFRQILQSLQIALLVVDEAHCISEWGHDFRTDYLVIGDIRHEIGRPPILALTATATQYVQRDIVKQLQLLQPVIIQKGLDRPNLSYHFKEFKNREEKWLAGVNFCLQQAGKGIIYMASRNECEQFCALLSSYMDRASIAYYHAGLEAHDRMQVQERFTNNELRIVVATNAFGMGIDKADIRFILHLHMPSSIEAYYQEAGRAGRDGKQSICAVFFQPQDRGIHQFFLKREYPLGEVYDAAAACVLSAPSLAGNRLEWEWLLQLQNVTQDNWDLLFHIWEQLGCLQRLDQDALGMALNINQEQLAQSRTQALAYLQRLKHRRKDKLYSMYRLLQSNICRRKQILWYFQPNRQEGLFATSMNLQQICCDICQPGHLWQATLETAAAKEQEQIKIAPQTLNIEKAVQKRVSMQTEDEEAYSIGEQRDSSKLWRLHELLLSTRVNTRRLACSAIGKIAMPESIPYILPILEDSNPQVRQYALGAIKKIGDPRAVAAVRNLLIKEGKEYNIRAAREYLALMKAVEEENGK